jgi:RHH-type proline utilization regulon transcriptional repressor/proline dehydrogenase/delta 1-pyrroline-5-carboxylate dehydrogenase
LTPLTSPSGPERACPRRLVLTPHPQRQLRSRAGTLAHVDHGAHASTAEGDILAVGRALHAALPSARAHPLRALDDRAMDVAASDAELRAALFRFVDVVPACRSLDDLARHLTGFLGEIDGDAPAHGRVAAAMKLGESKPGRAALGAAAAAGVRHMAHRFIVGEDVDAATGVLHQLWDHGVATSVDLLGEATITAAEADRYADRCATALDALSKAYDNQPPRPQLEADGLGPIPRANLSVKVSALTPLLRPDAPALGQQDASRRLQALVAHADAVGAHLHVDMESFDSREAVTDLVLDLLADPRNADGPSLGVVLQAYLVDSPQLCGRLIEQARRHPRAHPLVVRLVKGAYWDHEIVEARQHGWDAPVFEVKADSDRNFEALTRRLLEARAAGVPIRPAIASHNLRSIAHAIATTRALGLDDRDVELQVLRGLGDDLQDALAASGLRVRTYCPVGDLVAGMAYLVRRLLENTSNESFLADQAAGKPLEELLAAP